MTKRFLIICIGILLIILGWLLFFTNKQNLGYPGGGVVEKGDSTERHSLQTMKKTIILGKPELSGWIAYWKETEGYEVVDRNIDQVTDLSPEWFRVTKEKKFVEVGKQDKSAIAQEIKRHGIKLYPMLATDLTDQEIVGLLDDPTAWNEMTSALIEKLKSYQADGLDLDFENISNQYTKEFSSIVQKLGNVLKQNNFHYIVTVQARSGDNDWAGISGQDLSQISEHADQVRVMIYDKHGPFSDSGPVTPMDWYQEVVRYNLKVIPREKLVIALPTYGYIWNGDDTVKSYQYQDFIHYTKQNDIKLSRDDVSFELTFQNDQASGWLSDATAVAKKVEYARSQGVNKFVIWNFGGTDETLFDQQWEDIEVTVDEQDLER